jgi:hypothetical protein
MATDTKDLEALRTESQQLGARITRICIILISALTVVVFTITNALEKVDVRKLKWELEAAERSQKLYSQIYLDKQAESKDHSPGDGTGEKDKEIERLRDLWFKASEEEEKVQSRYDALLTESFSISAPLLGSNLKIDIRAWIYCIPFIALVAFIYIQILRKKQKTITVVAASQLSNNTEATAIDRLSFSERPGTETLYARSPAQLEQTIYLLIIVLLLSLVIVSLSEAEVVLLGLGLIETFQYLLMFLTVSFYGASYYYYVSTALDEQAADMIGWTVRQSIMVRTWRKLQALTKKFSTLLKPKISLTTGSLLVLTSLFLSTSASCDKDRQLVKLPGYRLLQEPGGELWRTQQREVPLKLLERLVKEPGLSQEEVDSSLQEMNDRLSQEPKGGWWISTVVNEKLGGLYWQNSVHNLGRLTYALSLIVAVFTLLIILCSLKRYELLKIRKVYVILFLLSATLSLFVIVDFAFNGFWFKDELFLLSNLFWIAPAALLCRITLSSRNNGSAAWLKLKTFLVILLLPLVLSATVYVCFVASKGFIGVLIYFSGINLISLTYLKKVSVDLNEQPSLQS